MFHISVLENIIVLELLFYLNKDRRRGRMNGKYFL
jgi:hypothetical protein